MAEVVNPSHHNGFAGSLDSMTSANGLVITMERTPDFSFPARSRASDDGSSRRPGSASMHVDIPRSELANVHRRTGSSLPSFSFNANDSSGRQDDDASPPRTPEELITSIPVHRGHRRGGSEFVGGDSRLGVANALSSSPTKTNVMMEPPALVAATGKGRRGHAHRRSAAISSHDIGNIMQPSQPRLSSSLPSTPLDFPAHPPTDSKTTPPANLENDEADPFGGPLEDPVTRPPSRPRVGFSDNVEFIPRPLSTISSETESSVSTLRGHSVNNSITSVLSIGASSPPSVRMQRVPPGESMNQASVYRALGGKRVEQEGQWLRHRSTESLKRPASESAATHPRTAFVEPDIVLRPRKRAVSHAFGFDRRKSEPAMCASANESSRLSTLSLQEPGSTERLSEDPHDFDSRSSARKIKDWATSKITKRSRDASRALRASSSTSSIRPVSAGSMSSSHDAEETPLPVAETDLDTVFSQNESGDFFGSSVPVQQRYGMGTSFPSPKISTRALDPESSDSMLDLDAALGPFNTPPIGSNRSRKELHSSRLVKDFGGPGGHYHRRSESAPALQPFEEAKESRRSPTNMADVFEEDEEDDSANVTGFVPRDEIWTRLPKREGEVVEVNNFNDTFSSDICSTDRGAAEQSDLSGLPKSGSLLSYGNTEPTPSGMPFPGRASSIVEETIPEENGLVGEVEIVEADDEPRISSQTKSSDSSDTPTIHAPQIGISNLADRPYSLMTPETCQTSAFSSPALRPDSFDASRLDTAASSIADNRTISSYATGDHSNELRISVDVPSLTSSRSTMISSVPGNLSRRELSNTDRTMSVVSENVVSDLTNDRQRKRGSIQSLSQLLPGSFSGKPRTSNDARPRTSGAAQATKAPQKEHRLKKLMFWKSKRNSTQLTESRP